jgi:hypothetical protein
MVYLFGDTTARSLMTTAPLVGRAHTMTDHGSFALLKNCSSPYRRMTPEHINQKTPTQCAKYKIPRRDGF